MPLIYSNYKLTLSELLQNKVSKKPKMILQKGEGGVLKKILQGSHKSSLRYWLKINFTWTAVENERLIARMILKEKEGGWMVVKEISRWAHKSFLRPWFTVKQIHYLLLSFFNTN